MDKKTILVAALVITSALFISGCAQLAQNEIKSPEQATQTVTNISQGVSDLGSTLEDIDKGLGG